MVTFKGEKIPICYASCSIGYDSSKHTLPKKLAAIAGAGFDAIELSMPDILAYGNQIFKTWKKLIDMRHRSDHLMQRVFRPILIN
jgi:hypothetical protein